MLKKHFHKILLLFTTLGITFLQAAQQDKRKKNVQETAIGYYNHTLKHSKEKIDNRLGPEELEKEKQGLKDNHIADKLNHKTGAVFFTVVASNNNTKVLSKFFFFNRDPNTDKNAIKRVTNLYRCHVISHTTPILSPHIIFQLMGWIEQNERKYTPVFIHSNCALCTTCHALAFNLFNLKMPKDAKKGCGGDSDVELEIACPLAQHYINSHLTLALTKKLLLPKVRKEYENKLQQMAKYKNKIIAEVIAKKDKQIKQLTKSFSHHIKLLKGFLKDRIELPYSPLKGHTHDVMSVVVTSDNKYIVSGSWDHTIRIWDLQTGKQLPYSPLKGHTWIVRSVTVTKDNKYILSGSDDNTIRIWDFTTGKELGYSPLKGHTSSILSVKVTDDNKYIVSGSWHKTIRIWDLQTGKEVNYSPLTGHTGSILNVEITHDNKYIVSCGGYQDSTIRIWHLKTGKEVNHSPLKGHASAVYSVKVTSDNQYIVSGSDDTTIRIWDFKTGKEVNYSPLKGHTIYVNSVAVTKGNKYIVSGSSDNTIRIWDLKTGKELSYSPLEGHTKPVRSLAVTKDNQYIVSGSDDDTIRIWDWKLLKYLYQAGDKEDNEVFDLD